jgi:excinuclease ABC subunit C
LLTALAATFGLRKAPRRIEVYDNSHIQGSNAVGAMIVAGPEGFRKNQYRKFNIRSETLTPGDDFGMMREVLTRRFKRLLGEAPRMPAPDSPSPPPERGRSDDEVVRVGVATAAAVDDPSPARSLSSDGASRRSVGAGPPLSGKGEEKEGERVTEPVEIEEHDSETDSPWPDLLLIDGGQGQLTAARETLAALGLTEVPLIGIAKGPERDAGRETFFMAGREPFRLRPRDPVLYFVERLRDEAHRFAVGSHRAKRKKDMRETGLQEIPGIGPTRKRALLRHFGTLKAIERASVADLEHVPGINAETARKIYDFFHESAARA